LTIEVRDSCSNLQISTHLGLATSFKKIIISFP
jgi:hypothetical protein